MAEYVIDGYKGSGKGIQALRMIKHRLQAGRPVATNLNLFLEHLCPPGSRTTILRLPDKPSLADMRLIGKGKPDGVKGEEQNGLIVLDECASFLNTREYKDHNRKGLFEWFLHSRKLGWDVVYIIQDFEALDKQFRDSFAETRIAMWRLDRLPVPFLGFMSRLLLGMNPAFPKVHIGTHYYSRARIKTRSDWTIAATVQKGYDTDQIFDDQNEYQGVSSTLSSWHMLGRHQTRWQMYKGVLFGSLLGGLLFGSVLTITVGKWMGFARPTAVEIEKLADVESDQVITGMIQADGALIFTLNDGRTLTSREFLRTASGVRAKVGNVWYRESDK